MFRYCKHGQYLTPFPLPMWHIDNVKKRNYNVNTILSIDILEKKNEHDFAYKIEAKYWHKASRHFTNSEFFCLINETKWNGIELK